MRVSQCWQPWINCNPCLSGGSGRNTPINPGVWDGVIGWSRWAGCTVYKISDGITLGLELTIFHRNAGWLLEHAESRKINLYHNIHFVVWWVFSTSWLRTWHSTNNRQHYNNPFLKTGEYSCKSKNNFPVATYLATVKRMNRRCHQLCHHQPVISF